MHLCVPTSTHGWFCERWPNFSLYVSAPAASARIWLPRQMPKVGTRCSRPRRTCCTVLSAIFGSPGPFDTRSEEHTSELQSRLHLVCRLLLEKKNTLTSLPATTVTTV